MKLITYLTERGLTRWAFARQLGVSHTTVGRLCAGTMTPSVALIQAIEKETHGQVRYEDLVPPATSPSSNTMCA